MKNEPVITAATVAGAIVALAAIFNVALDTGTVETVIVAVLPIVLSLFARSKVTPTNPR
jgi:hypothetical protein